MRKLFAALFVSVTSLGCNDLVGSNRCTNDGTDCFVDDGLIPELLQVSFQDVSTSGAADLPITWRVPSPCAEPCVRELQLASAVGDSVWALSRLEPVPSLELIDVAGRRKVQPIQTQSNTRALDRVALAGQPDGSALVHAQWTAVDGSSGPDLIQLYTEPGAQGAAISVPPTRGLVTPRRLLPTALGPLLYEGGSFSEAGLSKSVVRQLDPVGGPRWQTTKFPSFARIIGNSALELPGRIALGASDDDVRSPKFGILWLDEGGVPVRFASVSDSDWRSATLVGMANGAYALGADSDVLTTGLPGAGEGNIDVVVFAADGSLSGFRLKHDCFYKLTLNGFASDASGNLYVSSVTGSENEPRGLLCRLPPVGGGTARCYQAEVGTLIGKLVVTGSGALVATLGRVPPQTNVVNGPTLSSDTEIARIELPQ